MEKAPTGYMAESLLLVPRPDKGEDKKWVWGQLPQPRKTHQPHKQKQETKLLQVEEVKLTRKLASQWMESKAARKFLSQHQIYWRLKVQDFPEQIFLSILGAFWPKHCHKWKTAPPNRLGIPDHKDQKVCGTRVSDALRCFTHNSHTLSDSEKGPL